MSNTAYIRNIDSLEQLRVAVFRFCEDSNSQLLGMELAIQFRFEALRSMEVRFVKAIEKARDHLKVALAALSNCESDYDTDEEGNMITPDCSYERNHVYDCERKLARAEANYEIYKREIKKIQATIEEYQGGKFRYQSWLQYEKEVATASMKQLIEGAEDYLSVSSPFERNPDASQGLMEAVAKIDPVGILAATIGAGEIIIQTMISFLGVGGSAFAITNSKNKDIIRSDISVGGTEYTCTELKINDKGGRNTGSIFSISIPALLQKEKIGRHLITNMEALCRANDCHEISGWSTSNNIPFYTGLGYQLRNEVNGAGAEVYKTLESNFQSHQRNARDSFAGADEMKLKKKSGKCDINPLHIISPDEMSDEKFWKQHEREGMERYLTQVEQYDKCRDLLRKGYGIERIKKEDFSLAIAYENFVSKSDTIRLYKKGNYYKINGSGRHRVAAAQLYFLRTGRIIPVEAEITEFL